MKRKRILATTIAAAMLLSMVTPTAYAEDIVVGATAVGNHEAAAPVETEAAEAAEAAVDTYNATDVPINDTNFPDEIFRDKMGEYDTNGDKSLSPQEISRITSLDISAYQKETKISSLKGIEYLTALKRLDCMDNNLTSLDVSNNTKLTYLNCSVNHLKTLNVSKNLALTELSCFLNELSVLDVSRNTALTQLSCGANKLAFIDVSNNTALTILACSNNELASLDVRNNTELDHLGCSKTGIKVLDISNNTKLEYLECFGNQINALDVCKNTELTHLYWPRPYNGVN